MKIIESDVLIIGSVGAALRAAIEAVEEIHRYPKRQRRPDDS